MSSPEIWSVGRLLQWTADFLKRHGSDSPRLDAEVLLAHTIACERIQLYTAYDRDPGDDVRSRFREMVRRRAEGMPVAYLVGHREFYSMSFRVTPDVLIPRPETELLVVALLDRFKESAADPPVAICDVGTGSGAIAVAVAKHLPDCRVTAIDVSPAVLEVARENARAHEVEDRIDFVESDLLAAIPAGAVFDAVASNPPYVTTRELAGLSPDVRDHEPRLALDGGEQGTDVISRLIPQAADHLRPGGHFLLEISPTIHDAARALVAAESRFAPKPTIQDLARLPRVVCAVRAGAER